MHTSNYILFKSLIVILLTLLCMTAYGHYRTYYRPPLARTYWHGGTSWKALIAADHRFMLDSSRFYLLALDMDNTLHTLGGFKFSDNYGLLRASARTEHAVLFGGITKPWTNIPFVLKMDTVGAVIWSRELEIAPNSLNSVEYLFTHSNSISAFLTSTGGPTSSFILATGDQSGNFNVARRFYCNDSCELDITSVLQLDGQVDFLVACIASFQNGDSRLVMMRINSNGVQSIGTFDFEISIANPEGVWGLSRTADGDVLCVGWRGLDIVRRVIKMDVDANIIWSKEYTLNAQDLELYDIHTTADSGALVSVGGTILDDSFVFKLNASGDIEWMRQYFMDQTSQFNVGEFYESDQGDLITYNFHRMTEIGNDGSACDLTPISGMLIEDVPIYSDMINVSDSILPFSSQALPFDTVHDTFQNILECTSVGIEESVQAQVEIHPNPVADVLFVELGNINEEVRYSVVDLLGRTVRTGVFIGNDVNELFVDRLTPGVYHLTLGLQHHTAHRFIKE